MTTSAAKSSTSELYDGAGNYDLYDKTGKFRPECAGYFTAAAQAEAHQRVIRRFIECRPKGITKSVIARRLNKRPEQITRWLASPGNWTIETYAMLMLALEGMAKFDYVCLTDVAVTVAQSRESKELLGHRPTETSVFHLTLTYEAKTDK